MLLGSKQARHLVPGIDPVKRGENVRSLTYNIIRAVDWNFFFYPIFSII